MQGGTDIELANTESRTALHYAAKSGNLEIVAFLWVALHYALAVANDAMDGWVVDCTTALNQWSTTQGIALNVPCRSDGVKALKKIFESRRVREAR